MLNIYHCCWPVSTTSHYLPDLPSRGERRTHLGLAPRVRHAGHAETCPAHQSISNIRWVHDTHENTYTNGGIVVILMWIYRLVTVLLCQNKLYTLSLRTLQIWFTIYCGGGGGVNDSFSVHAPVELHDIVLLQFRRIHSQLSYNRNIT